MMHPHYEKPDWKYVPFSIPNPLSNPVQVMFLVNQSMSEQMRRQSQARDGLVGKYHFTTLHYIPVFYFRYPFLISAEFQSTLCELFDIGSPLLDPFSFPADGECPHSTFPFEGTDLIRTNALYQPDSPWYWDILTQAVIE